MRHVPLLCLIALTGCASMTDAALRRADDAIADKNYGRATEHVNRAISYSDTPTPERQQRIALTRAKIYEGTGNCVAANALYRSLVQTAPLSDAGLTARGKLSMNACPEPAARPEPTVSPTPSL